MCELLAISSVRPFDARSYLSIFAERGGRTAQNKDGWGVVIREQGGFAVTREAEPAFDSTVMASQVRRATRVDLLVAHIRLATQGRIAIENTQPFLRELRGGAVAFMHNGYLKDYKPLSTGPRPHAQALGDTDSERAFCDLIDLCDDRRVGGPTLETFSAFSRHASQFGPSNFIAAAGDTIFIHAHRRTQGNGRIEPPGLWLLKRADQNSRSPEIGLPGQTNVTLIASVPLTTEAWTPIPEGTVLEVKQGQVTRVAALV